MTTEIATVFTILGVSVIFLVTEWIPMEVTALLVLGVVALTGLVTPNDALAGFSNPAVVTVWAVFILSGGLTRTGVANLIGRVVLRLAGRSETLLVVVVMISAGAMSAIMNNVAVAALMMPVVMDIARSTGKPASRLLLPLAYGSLLGGLTTQIGTPPNILVSEALRENGLKPFTLFDFTPVGLAVFAAGVTFTALFGRHLLPTRNLQHDPQDKDAQPLKEQYRLRERLLRLGIPPHSILVGKTIAASRIGTILGVNVVGIRRQDRVLAAPGPSETLRAEDKLIVESGIGGIGKLRDALHSLGQLQIEPQTILLDNLLTTSAPLAEITVAHQAEFAGGSLRQVNFRKRFGANVLAVRQGAEIQRTGQLWAPGTRAGFSGVDRSGPGASPSVQSQDFDTHHGRRPLAGDDGLDTDLPFGGHRCGGHGSGPLPDHGGGLSRHRVEGHFSDRGHDAPGRGLGQHRRRPLPGHRGGRCRRRFRSDGGHGRPDDSDLHGHLRHTDGRAGGIDGPHHFEHGC
ncbi:MAG: SLC13 family permease [Desulfobacterales bacterium]|nr:SLC13 family permease [Desulfobacterales bacterium]